MGIFRMIIIALPVKVGRHCRMVTNTVLATIKFAKFDACNLRNRVSFIGFFQCAR